MKLNVRYEGMHINLGSINDNARKGFQVSTCGKPWTCRPTIVSYCCDTQEGHQISGVKHGATLYSCIHCLVSKDDITTLAHGATRYKKNMCNAYNKLRSLLDEALVEQRRGHRTAAREKRGQSKTELHEDSLAIQEKMLTTLSLTNR